MKKENHLMKKFLAKGVTTALVALMLAAAFTGCGLLGGKDGRVSVKDMPGYFRNGLCAAKDDTGKTGYIDKDGNWKIEDTFASADAFNGGSARVNKLDTATSKDSFYLINTKGEKISETYDLMHVFPYDGFDNSKIVYAGLQFDKDNPGDPAKTKVFVLNTKGKVLWQTTGDKFGYDNYQRALIVSNGETDPTKIKYGAVDILTGKEILSVEYDEISEMYVSGGKYGNAIDILLKLQKGTDASAKYGIADTKGKVLVKADKYKDIGYTYTYTYYGYTYTHPDENFYFGVTKAVVDEKTTDFINEKGKVLFTLNTTDWTDSYFERFDNKGVMLYSYEKENKGYSFIVDKKGKTILSGVYDNAKNEGDYIDERDDEGYNTNFLFKVSVASSGKNTLTVYDLKGKSLYSVTDTDTVSYEYVEAYTQFGIAAYETGKTLVKTTMHDKKGKPTATVIEANSAPYFDEFGFAAIRITNDGKTTGKLINLKNETVIDNCYSFSGYYTIEEYKDVDVVRFTTGKQDGGVFQADKQGYINSKGKIVLAAKYAEVDWEYYGGKLFMVADENTSGDYKYGYCDKDGKIVVGLTYDSADAFIGGFAKVGKDDTTSGGRKYGLIDEKGNVAVTVKFTQLGYVY